MNNKLLQGVNYKLFHKELVRLQCFLNPFNSFHRCRYSDAHFPGCRVIDLGGRIGIEDDVSASTKLSAIDESLEEVKRHMTDSETRFHLESGRSLAAQAGVLLAKVTQTR